jgi:phosphate-selective porin OprO/OprP
MAVHLRWLGTFALTAGLSAAAAQGRPDAGVFEDAPIASAQEEPSQDAPSGVPEVDAGTSFAPNEVGPKPEAQGNVSDGEAESPDDDTMNASEADDGVPKKARSTWNAFEWKLLTLRLGGGLLYDFAAYDQDPVSQTQLELRRAAALRDFRFVLKGNFKFAPRLSYTLGYMYDGATGTWRFRQTGLMLDLPELNGDLFIGRTKEGFSTNKVMTAYNLWTNERAAANEAFIPILADGIKWTGHSPGGSLVYNLGWYIDVLSETESFNRNDMQMVGRLVWLPLVKRPKSPLLHLVIEGRYGKSDDGFFQFRSKPEAAQSKDYAIDTGKFPAAFSGMGGLEAYLRLGSLIFGLEYFLNKVSSPETNNPLFHGGEAFAALLITGETRGYNARGGYFEPVSPDRPLGASGPGAIELVVRCSYADLDDGLIAGGRFWRLTAMVNWYLNDVVRIELVYGYGRLNRSDAWGTTQFFQGRLQFQIN